MSPPYESFRNKAAGIQSWIIGIAVLVGGGWTLYTFVALDMVKRAQKDLYEQAQIIIKIDAKQEDLDSGETCVAAIVEITNKGARNVLLDYSAQPFSVAKMSFDDEGRGEPGDELNLANVSTSRVLRAGETVQYPYAFSVKESGMYILQFQVPLPPAEMEEHLKHGGPNGAIYWMGSTLVNVKQRTVNGDQRTRKRI